MSFAQKLKNFFSGKKLDDETFEELTDLLVEGDFGAAGAYKLALELEKACKKEKIDSGEGARKILAGLLERLLKKAKTPPQDVFGRDSLTVLLLLGVNGVGKTTTIAKLARAYKDAGMEPVIAASDTFRAAAIEQLKIHGERLGVRVVAHQSGADPAAVIFDAAAAVSSRGGGIVLADTAGRLHNKENLIRELQKIDRVAEAKASPQCYKKILVIDATTGQNAFRQAEAFHEAVKVDGVALTKWDSSAKGGSLYTIGKELGLPVFRVCFGEGYGDIAPFDAETYARGFLGLEP